MMQFAHDLEIFKFSTGTLTFICKTFTLWEMISELLNDLHDWLGVFCKIFTKSALFYFFWLLIHD